MMPPVPAVRGERVVQALVRAGFQVARKRYPGIEVIDTDHGLARRIGNILAAAGAGSEHHVDATVVAHGGGVILTSDPNDIERLAQGLVGIDIERL